jgi:hypothetical protein
MLGSGDFFVVDGRIFRGSHWESIAADPVLADPPSDRARFRGHPYFGAQDRALDGIFCILLAALQGHSRRATRMALVVGAHGAIHCRRLLSARRDTPSFCGQPHGLAIRFPAGFDWRCVRSYSAVSVVSIAIGPSRVWPCNHRLNSHQQKQKARFDWSKRAFCDLLSSLEALEASSFRRRLLLSWGVLSFLSS